MSRYTAGVVVGRECGPFRIHPVKTRISFIARMSFAGAELKKQWIDAAFMLPYRSDSPRFRKIESYGRKSHGHYLRIHTLDEIDDEVRAWACEAYWVGRQEL